MSTFQLFLLMFFAAIGLLAVFAFSGFIPLPGSSSAQQFGGEVVMWGTLSRQSMSEFVSEFNSEHANEYRLAYTQIDSATFEDTLISELASGRGPDMVLFPHDLLISQGDKLYPIPDASFSKRLFKDTYIDEGELYWEKDGISALPLYVDPLVMYWNRDLFSAGGIVEPPKVWEQFPALPASLTVRDSAGNITQSAVGLGGVRNIEWSKDILSTLIMQVGDPITSQDAEGRISGVLGDAANGGSSSAPAAVRFYTEFSNPSKTSYSWNSSLLNSKTSFEAGTLAVYFGRASDYSDIKRKNPHLNFDVAVMPQRDKAQKKITFAQMYGVGVLRASRNPETAFTVAFELASPQNGAVIASAVGLPSAARSVLSVPVQDPILDVFNRSAIISRGWYDPAPAATSDVFAAMVESVIINKTTEEDAVSSAGRRLDSLFGN